MCGIKKNEKFSKSVLSKSGALPQGVFMGQKMWSSYEELQSQLKGVLSSLTPLEQDVLKMRFGLDDGKSHTIKEVCDRFGMTRLDVRAVEAKALRRLRRGKGTKTVNVTKVENLFIK